MNADVRFNVDGKTWYLEVELADPPRVVGWRVEERQAPAASQPGLGDAVAAATKAVGVKPCGGCARRQKALNAATPSWARRILGRLGVGGSRPGRSPGSAPP